MSIVAIKGFLIGSSIAAAGGVVILRVLAGGETVALNGTGGAQAAAPADSSTSLTISGNAATLISPGNVAPIDLRFSNSAGVPVLVGDLTVTVRAISAPNADEAHPCAVGDFTVNQAAGGLKITVAARATSTLSSLDLPNAQWPQVGLLERSVNQDGCKGASLTLGYAASGTTDN